MDKLQELIQQLTKMEWSDYLDIFVVAFIIYKALPLLRSTGAMRVARVVLAFFVITWLTDIMELYTLNFLLDQVLAVGLIAIVVLFQPELRRMVDHLSSVKLKRLLGMNQVTDQMDTVIAQTVQACDIMSRERVGALIVFAKDVHLEEYMKSGTAIDGQVSEQLIRNIFFPKAALHDGAMIIKEGRVAAAGCVLPLSDSTRLSADLGTRHRAGVGMSEATDAVVVIVSEETGALSVAVGGMLKRHLAPQTLERLLHNELCPQPQAQEENLAVKLRQKLQIKGKGEDLDD